jgi:hypothetical protein
MKERIEVDVPYNKKCETTDEFPRHFEQFETLVRVLESHGIIVIPRGLVFEGNNILEVIQNMAKQIEKLIGPAEVIQKRRIVPSFGDGGVSVFINALLEILMGQEMKHALLPHKGGTMCNLSNALGLTNAEIIAGIIRKEIQHAIRELRIREADITTFDKDKNIKMDITVPWLNSAGFEIAGEWLKKWNEKPKSNRPLWNLGLLISEVAEEGRTKTNINGHSKIFRGQSVTTLPNLGPFKLPQESFSHMETDEFAIQTFHATDKKDFFRQMVTYLVAGANPTLCQWLWDNIPTKHETSTFSDFWQILSDIKPETKSQREFKVDHTFPDIHLDGTDFPLKLEKDETATILLKSTKKSMRVGQAKNNNSTPFT